MTTPKAIATQFRALYFGGNATGVAMRPLLEDVTFQEATHKIYECNTIGTLLYHTQYYVRIITRVLEGGPLEGHDSLSFNHPPINSGKEWDKIRATVWTEIEHLATVIEELPPEKLWEDFALSKYGNYYRNLHGTLEHSTYHLGQMALLKKIIRLGD